MPAKKNQPEEKASGSMLGWLALLAVIAAVAVFAMTRSPEPPPVAQAPPVTRTQAAPTPVAPAPTSPVAPTTAASDAHDHSRVPAYFENPDAAEPLAPTLDPNTVKAYAKTSYEVAQSKPRLLAQLPCFCYCDRFGHKSLHDCFVSNHAEECDICMKEALDANEMDAEGMSPQEIRSVIIAGHQHGSS